MRPLILFTSDNGGAAYTRATDNAPLEAGKCSMFEGGLRVPFFIKFPGDSPAAGSVYENPVSLLDMFTTIAAGAGAPLPADRTYDGRDLRPYVEGENESVPHEALFWRNGYLKACIADGWKLYVSKKRPRLLLYNLNDDPGETTNIAHQYPEKVRELRELLIRWEVTQTVDPLWPSSGNFLQWIKGKKVRFPV